MREEKYYPIPRDVLVVTMIMSFAMWAPLLAVPPLEPIITGELAISNAEASLLFSAPILVVALVAIPAGFMADTIGIKKTAGIGMIIIVLGSALKGTVGSFPALLTFTLLYGLGLGLSFPNLPKLVSHCSPKEKAHVTMGIFTAGIVAAGAVPLAITRPLVYPVTSSYQGAFLIWSIPPLVAAVLWWTLIRDPPCESAAAGNVGMDVALLRRVLKQRNLWLASLLFFLHNFFFYTWAGWITQYLISLGALPDTAGLILSVTLWVAIPWVILITRVSSKLGVRKPFLWAPSLALALVAWAAPGISLAASWFLMAATGIAASTRFTTILALPVELSSPEQSGTASGLIMSVGYLGALLGPLAAGYILDRTGSYQYIFLSLFVVSLLTAAFTFPLPETGRRRSRS